MKSLLNGILLVLFLSFSFQIIAQENWTFVDSGTTDNLVDVCFSDNNYGWIIGSEGTLLRTSDGGENWNTSTLPYQNLKAVKFVNENEGWIIGNQGLILKTTDSGNTWFEQSGGQNYALEDLYFQSNQVGFICGGFGVILKTTNGGGLWETQNIHNKLFNSVFFINSNIGWLTESSGTIYKTSNAGTSWDSVSFITSDIYEASYRATIFLDTLNGICCNNYDMTGNSGGEIYKTTDGGYKWHLVETTTTQILSITREPSSNLLYAVGYNHYAWGSSICYSTNAGDNWIEETNSVYPYLRAIDITANRTGWAVGYNGTILRNSNLVSNEIIDSTGFSNNVGNYSLYQNYPNPFNPTTKIKYHLPEFCNVELTVYDVLGRNVNTLVNEEKPAGFYEVEFDGANLPSGIYFYNIKAGNYSQTKKMIHLK